MTNVLFFGRKKWSMYALIHLIENDYNIIGVIGRPGSEELDGAQESLLDVAFEHNIPVYDYSNVYDLINNETKTFNGEKVDLIISYLFWGKLKSQLLNISKQVAINFHPGPLPDYQGLGGYNAAILDEKTEYGVTAHIMNESIDAGDILKVNKFKIDFNETAYSLEQKSMVELYKIFLEIFSEDLQYFIKNKYPNDTNKGKYINRKQFEEMKIIKELDSQTVIDRKVRAFWYPPYEGAKFKIGDSYYTLVNQPLLKEISKLYHD